VGGFMIPDIMARDSQTIPPRFASLRDLALNYPRNQQRTGYGLSSYIRHAAGLSRARISGRTMLALAQEVLRTKLQRRPYQDAYWRYVLLLQQLYTDAFLQLYRTYHPRLATYHFHAVDTISHRYWWDLSDEKSADQEALPTAYQAADRTLGDMLKLAGLNTTVLLVSDHGFQTLSEERSWYIARLPHLIQILGLENAATPTRLGKQHFLYFRDASHAEVTGNTLRASTFKETGSPLLPHVVVRDTSLFFLPPQVRGDGLTVAIPGHAEVPFEELFTDTGHVETGIHDPEGIVILAGPSVRQGIGIEEASILDVTPTALTLLVLPVARDMPGRVWTEAMREEFLNQSPVTFVDTYTREAGGKTENEIDGKDAEVLYRRLHDLGYL
jgi:arylsulfatase A-like enzyme